MPETPENGFLRLFPLQGTVLFPGMELPLVVFEPRYLQLARECTEAGEPFGVVLLRDGREVGDADMNPHDVGTTAHITSLEDVGGGRKSLNAVGGRRFKITSLSHENPYLSAHVEYLDDDTAGMVDPSVVANVQEDAVALVRAVMALQGGYVRDIRFPDDPVELSYRVAQLFQGNNHEQQRLLEAPAFDRLWDEIELMKSAMDRITRRTRRRGPGTSFSAN